MDETRLAQLRDFIVEARKQGETYDVIRQQLLSSGWSDGDVNEYLPTAWQQVEAASAPAAPPAAMPATPPAEPAEPPVGAPAEPAAYTPPVVAPVTPPVQPAYTPPVTPPVTTAPPAYPAPAQPVYGAAPAAYPPGYGMDNTSGNPLAPVPPEVEAMGWSWGGFGLNWIWGLGNKVYIALLGLIPCVGLAVAIWLGVAGHKMAWQNRRFESFEQYQETMKAWNTWGLILFIVGLVGNVISVFAQMAMKSHTGN